MGKHILNHVRKRSTETKQAFIERRFWSKVEKTDDCWLWRAGTRRKDEGYGQFFLNGKPESAHRVSLMLNGVILSENDVVAHRCDNPPCVNPDHLFVTDSPGNTADRHIKGRTASHEHNGNAHLTDEDVARIREAALFGARTTDLAKIWGTSRNHVWRLVTNKMRKEQRPLP
jgi:hypothetical protein